MCYFKPVTYRGDGKAKGNVDAELVLQAMIDFDNYERAVIVTSDGDFACLGRYLYEKGKRFKPNRKTALFFLKEQPGKRLISWKMRKNQYKIRAPRKTKPTAYPPGDLSSSIATALFCQENQKYYAASGNGLCLEQRNR
jgi:hypothetical protein